MNKTISQSGELLRNIDVGEILRLREQLADLQRELEQERQDRKQADLDTIRALGERNDARAELERRENARAIQAMTPQERHALMFQQTPTDDQAGDPP